MPYRNLPALTIPADLAIPTCNHCGSEWIDAATAKALDAALERVYAGELRKRLRRALERIRQKLSTVSQRRIEGLIGLSPGYLSKLSQSSRDPSPQIVSTLSLLAEDPANLQKATEHLQKSADLDPTNHRALYNLGLAYQHLQRWEDAERALRGAHERAPGVDDYEYALAVLLTQQKQPAKARDVIRRLLQRNPQHYDGQMLLQEINRMGGE